jgi:hypothetical protein
VASLEICKHSTLLFIRKLCWCCGWLLAVVGVVVVVVIVGDVVGGVGGVGVVAAVVCALRPVQRHCYKDSLQKKTNVLCICWCVVENHVF